MKLSEFKNYLNTIDSINIVSYDGNLIPKHFHITEVGLQTKHFIDCGGTERIEKNICIQLWVANDIEHKLQPQKVLDIIQLSGKVLNQEDLEIEVQYQTATISLFDLDFDGANFILLPKQTDCLAKDKCGIPEEKLQVENTSTCCTPNSGCC
ncbi:MAG: hypothetical protein H6553_00920 [Chitinophagales bacterium]|nr:hypothetical protein [Chitinophagales bacterium]